MSLHTLKKKADANSHSRSQDGSFAINGGARNLSYVGKSMRNSSVKTPFRGTIPMGFNGDVNNSIVMAFPKLKADLGRTIPQVSVRNTKSMIATKYKWLGGQYPIYWTQPNMNLTSAERTAVARVSVFHEQAQEQANNPSPSLNPSSNPSLCCEPINRSTSVRTIIQRIIERNANGVDMQPPTSVDGFSDYMSRLQAATLIQSGDNKPFPFYVNNASGQCGHMPIYSSAPDWHKTIGSRTRAETNQCELAAAIAALASAMAEAATAIANAAIATETWNIVQMDGITGEAADNAEAEAQTTATAAVDAQTIVVAAAVAVYNHRTLYCHSAQSIQSAHLVRTTETDLLNDLTDALNDLLWDAQ